MSHSRLGNLPLRKGDSVVLTEGGKQREFIITRARQHEVTAQSGKGRATVILTEEGGGAVLRLDVKEIDDEGRVRLDD